MKIQCDVCNKDEASVFCSADEAALCNACDHRVHHANKLAGKHQRFSLLHPSSAKQAPICDICQERRAFLFCQQDRAILCRACDIPIHRANEHTQKHHRFLLTGVKLSATTALYSPSNPSPNHSNTEINGFNPVPNFKFQDQNNPIPAPLSSTVFAVPNPHSSAKTATVPCITTSSPPPPPPPPPPPADVEEGNGNNGTTSSISEYLMETLPGWHVEDFLDSPSSVPFGLCKSNDNDAVSFWDADFDGNLSSKSFSSETLGMWVPHFRPSNMAFSGQISFKQSEDVSTNMKAARKWIHVNGGCFTVPQMHPPANVSKRSKIF